jgi:hypothetical protein
MNPAAQVAALAALTGARFPIAEQVVDDKQ